MALPPDTPNEAFLREVEENYRRDQIEGFAKSYGKWILIVVVVFLAAVGGWLYWQQHQAEQAAEDSEELHRIFADVSQQNLKTVPKRLDALEESSSDAVRALALLTQAAVALEGNDRKLAIAKYRELAEDKGLPDAFRNIATIRRTATEFDAITPEQVIARLEPLATPGSPWFGSAAEMVALAHLKAGRDKQAGQIFAQIAADPQVPQTLRSRAVQIAGTLGVDASGSLPAIQQQD